MSKKEFKAESKRLMELMIHSIYTHKDIFMREIISNASDAQDKLCYRALTDDSIDAVRENMKINIDVNRDLRTLTISDMGIGMTKDELETNLGTIAKSGSHSFKEQFAEGESAPADIDVIGQFGVGFYSAFMVADNLTVVSKAQGEDSAYIWQSSGVDGYTISKCEKDTVGTDIVIHLKDDNEDDNYSQYLESNKIQEIIKKYSDYIHYPIQMEVEEQEMKDFPENPPEDYKPEWYTVTKLKTLNSMTPLWQKAKKDVGEEEYQSFYSEKFMDWHKPLSVIHTGGEGQVSYKALMFIPSAAPYDFYTREYEKGLQLYSSGVMIMQSCADLLPDHFRFVKGVVDTQDISLNISRELLQQTRPLKLIANNVERKIKSELKSMQTNKAEEYEKFWTAFGVQLKYGVCSDNGKSKDLLKDLLMFYSSKEEKNVSLEDYKSRMTEEQEFIYYACGESIAKISKLPQVERILDKGFEILYCTDSVDDFVMKAVQEIDGKKLKSVSDEDALPQTEDEKKESEQKQENLKSVTEKVKEILGEKVFAVRISSILKSSSACLTAEGPISLEMEKYMSKVEGAMPMKAQRVLELNPDNGAVMALQSAIDSGDDSKAENYAKLLYGQSLLMADLPLEDPAEFAVLISELMK